MFFLTEVVEINEFIFYKVVNSFGKQEIYLMVKFIFESGLTSGLARSSDGLWCISGFFFNYWSAKNINFCKTLGFLAVNRINQSAISVVKLAIVLASAFLDENISVL